MLVVVASLLAGSGLAVNSSVVVVASMLVSPLMGPILAITFGTKVRCGGYPATGDQRLSVMFWHARWSVFFFFFFGMGWAFGSGEVFFCPHAPTTTTALFFRPGIGQWLLLVSAWKR